MPGQDADSPKAETVSSDVTQEQSETNPPVQPSEVMPENNETSTTSETVTPEHADTTQTPQTEATETTVNKDTSPDGKTSADADVKDTAAADAGTPSDDAQPASANGGDPPSSAAAGPADGTADGTGECYRYEDDVCIYTDPSSGVEYVYSSERDGWVRRDGSGDGQPLHAPTLENCYYVGEHYCFRDAAGTVYRLDPDSNSWQEWSGGGADAEGSAEGDAEGGADTSADTGGAAPADGDGRCFRSADGAWCCRDDSGALCRWDADAGRWQRADAATTTTTTGAVSSSSPVRRAGPTSRKRRLNRGSSDDSEHDSDEDDSAPAKKRTPYVAARLTDGDGQAEHEGPPDAGDNDGPSDGSGYEWDPERGAWFPKIDEEFLALHRLNYGFDSEGRAVETAPILDAAPPPAEAPPPEKQEAGKQRKLNTKKKPEWFQLDDSKNTKVYVSGLPEDVTEDEFVELMSKCGLVMKDPMQKNAWKIKLYRDDYGVPKGDAICTYIKIESVNLALDILDGYEFKGKTLTVEKATFDMKGKFDPSKKPKKKNLKKKDREKLQKKQEKLFAWQPDKIRGERERHERVVILKNLFSPEEFKTRPEALLEYQQDLREECGKFGPVKKVVVHDRHADGVAEVIFQEAIDADSCVLKMNGRWFAGRQLQAATWDGKTKYRVEETEEERAERLAKWEQFITGEDKSAEDKSSGDAPAEDKPAEDNPAEDNPAEDATMEDKPAEDNAADDKPSEDAPSDEAPAEDVPMSDATPAEEASTEDAPSEDKPA